ncbi:hypothetical protein MHBO_003659 [Bonamia ostreae]|uniref:NADH dehydrogenase subunit 3 n=1 Tax=Bonamia ostreae TaxID=126728 RepID=A0ABV2AR59_9EUKA
MAFIVFYGDSDFSWNDGAAKNVSKSASKNVFYCGFEIDLFSAVFPLILTSSLMAAASPILISLLLISYSNFFYFLLGNLAF